MEKKRYDFIDIIRMGVIFCVFFAHTNSSLLLQTPMSATWLVSETLSSMCKPGIPLFVMISGYTMLDRIYDYKNVGQKVLRIVLALFVFSVPYYMFQWLDGTRFQISLADFFFSVFQYPQTIAFWYMYMYIGLLIMLPFMQKMMVNLNKRDCEVFIGITFVISAVWPIVEHLCPQLTYSRLFDFALFDSYLCFLVLGYYMKKYVTPSKNKTIVAIVVYILSEAFVVAMTYHEYMINGGVNFLFYDDVTQAPAVLQAIAIFYFVSQIKLEGKVLTIIKTVGGCTFGMYLLSDLLIVRLNPILGILYAMGISPLIAIIIFDVMLYVLAFAIVYILKKIPGIRQLV